ncbi:uncharacterized protein EKO05_0000006 [Ascochyta rabiei]|uniref:uncharacterized protein n=1 Tax=Didymella rabiei TaxID=5454 RepID=UPI0022013725|nr:uncharacterized protein EKO05_0000006 [Ascochyta rabiei]UPX09315.1 hypothetical protein EKO05_0000006 [Ascochyta rabiei]
MEATWCSLVTKLEDMLEILKSCEHPGQITRSRLEHSIATIIDTSLQLRAQYPKLSQPIEPHESTSAASPQLDPPNDRSVQDRLLTAASSGDSQLPGTQSRKPTPCKPVERQVIASAKRKQDKDSDIRVANSVLHLSKRACRSDKTKDLGDSHIPELRKLQDKYSKYDKLCRMSVFEKLDDSLSSRMLCRIAAMQGGPAIRQFCTLVHHSRSRETNTGLLQVQGEGIERALCLARSLQVIVGRADFDNYLTRIAQLQMAMAIDGTDGSKTGRIRAAKETITDSMDRLGWPHEARPKFHWHLKRGRQWNRLCGSRRALIVFIPFRAQEPYNVNASDYLAMKGDELDRFHQLVDTPFEAAICRAAEWFQDSLIGSSDDVEFCWEKQHPNLRNGSEFIRETELTTLLQPFPFNQENLFDPAAYPSWPKPPKWPSHVPWPSHPLAVQSSERQCHLCDKTKCDCASRIVVRHNLRIKSYAQQGLGVQATASYEGELSFRKGDVIGQLSGKLVPPGTYSVSWTLDVARPDISGEPTVCQIYAGESSNCLRLVNHSCRASARLRLMKVSGFWNYVIEASRDMRHGEQVTVNFGKRFLREQGIKCCCEACN